MHGDISQYHLIFNPVRGPVSVGIQDQTGPVLKGPVAGGYDIDIQFLYPLQVPLDAGAEGHHDPGIVLFSRKIEIGLI